MYGGKWMSDGEGVRGWREGEPEGGDEGGDEAGVWRRGEERGKGGGAHLSGAHNDRGVGDGAQKLCKEPLTPDFVAGAPKVDASVAILSSERGMGVSVERMADVVCWFRN